MSHADLKCWHCGSSLKDLPQPLNRLAQCKSCGADLHVCRQCKFYDPKLHTRCNHEMAEPAREIDLANFCHYFRASAHAFIPKDKSRNEAAMANLKSLFGDTDGADLPDNEISKSEASDKDAAREKFDSIFKNK